MMKEYNISGITCLGCVEKVKKQISSYSNVDKVEVQIESPQAKIWAQDINLEDLNKSFQSIGNYTIQEIERVTENNDLPAKSIVTYKPLILIILFILGVAVLVQYPFYEFDYQLGMRHFMAGFFIVFSFFKLLNLKGFMESYRMYDIIADKWSTWGYIYPFLELFLGIAYLLNILPFETNLFTITLLGISSIGVIKSNLDKKKIKCACLGDVFNLPMSTVTIIEDLSMVGMAILMLWWY